MLSRSVLPPLGGARELMGGARPLLVRGTVNPLIEARAFIWLRRQRDPVNVRDRPLIECWPVLEDLRYYQPPWIERSSTDWAHKFTCANEWILSKLWLTNAKMTLTAQLRWKRKLGPTTRATLWWGLLRERTADQSAWYAAKGWLMTAWNPPNWRGTRWQSILKQLGMIGIFFYRKNSFVRQTSRCDIHASPRFTLM